jgi:gliding motility-associated-like protein
MRIKSFTRIFCFVIAFWQNSLTTQAQQIVNYSVPFESGMQNMWGPSWDPFSINMTVPLFNVNWNESFDYSAITNILGSDFGAGINGHFSGTIGSEFKIQGFSSGEVEVKYPINVELDMNSDATYDPGDQVTVSTSYTLEPGYELNTIYPNAGEATLDVYFEMGAGLSATLCAFGCVTFPIIPSFSTGMQNINILTLNESEISFFSFNGGTPLYSYPIFPLSTTLIPGDPLGNFGLEGVLDLPHVYTTDGASGTDLYACGGGEDADSAYVQISLNIFDLLGNIPGPVGEVLANLDGSEDIPLGVADATVSWSFFSAFLNLDFFNKQCFDFTPKVYGKYEFPVAVDYTAYSPTGTVTSSGTSSIIDVQVGGSFNYKFPCYFEELNIVPTYRIDGTFRNHTYDSVQLSLNLSAISFSLTIPAIEITPAIYVPEICIPIPYPCPSWSCPWCWCTYTACTPAFTIPAVGSPAIDISLADLGLSDPLWSYTWPITNFSYDWYNNTWPLEGFDEYTMPAFTMVASPQIISATQTNVLCNGDNTGAIDVTINATSYDLSTPYVYSWTSGQTTQDISGLTAGPYNVIVYDAHGCELFAGATILEPAQPLAIAYTKQDKLCNGGVNSGLIDITITGGTAPYAYSWSNGQTTQDINSLDIGSYIVTVTDANNCIQSLTIDISQPNLLGQTAAITNVKCNGALDGIIQVDVFGGELPYSYSWSSGQTTEDLSDIAANNYTLTLTDGNGCTSTQSYLVTQPAAALSLSVSATNVSCHGGSNGAVDLTTSGGTPGYLYQWSSAGLILPFVTEDLTGLTAGTYLVSVTDANGCTAQASQLITQPSQEISSTPALVHINCFGQSTGSIDPAIFGGTAAYAYAWSTGATSSTLTGIPAGNYSLAVTDFNGCIKTFSYTLVQPAAALNISLTGTNVLCFGDSTGSVSSLVTGGTTPYAYLWSNGATAPNVNNLIAGTYSLALTDSKGCVALANQTITQPAAPLTLSTTPTNVLCFGNATGAIDLTSSGGTGPYTYQWSNSAMLILNIFTQDISALVADTYIAVVTDANGCQATVSTLVTQPAAPLNITGTVNDANCFGLNDGAVDITITGGTSGYSFVWSNSAVTEDISAVLSGIYSVVVTDAYGCTNSSAFIINQPAAPLIASLTPTDVICNGGNTGSILSSVSGGTSPYSYLWSTGDITPQISSLAIGAYSLTVTDAQGCIAFTGAVINAPAALVVSSTITNVSCFGFSDGEVVLSISGGVQPYYFSWGDQHNILLNNPSETLNDMAAAVYYVVVEDANGCKNEQYLTVSGPALQVASYTVTNTNCYGDNTGAIDVTYAGGTPPFATVWSNGQTTEDAITLVSGVYIFTGTDTHGCLVSDTAFVDQPDSIQLTYEIVPVSCVDLHDGGINVTPAGGTTPYAYTWSDGQTAQNATQLQPGIYSLVVTDNNLCNASFGFEILANLAECVIIPNTFTPNNDDYNDTWVLGNLELYPNASVKVFNKWGNELFTSENAYTPWDGKQNGNPLPSEVYYYIIELNNPENNTYTGTLTIIR